MSAPGLASLEGCRQEDRQDLLSVIRFRLAKRVGEWWCCLVWRAQELVPQHVLTGRPRRLLGWVIPTPTWCTHYQANLHLLWLPSPKLGITAKLRDLKSQFMFSLVYRWVQLQFLLFYCSAELAQPCWRWYQAARHCFCDHSHTVVIMFDIMHILILSVSLTFSNEVRYFFIEWSYFITVTTIFLFRGKNLIYWIFWINLYYDIFL